MLDIALVIDVHVSLLAHPDQRRFGFTFFYVITCRGNNMCSNQGGLSVSPRKHLIKMRFKGRLGDCVMVLRFSWVFFLINGMMMNVLNIVRLLHGVT